MSLEKLMLEYSQKKENCDIMIKHYKEQLENRRKNHKDALDEYDNLCQLLKIQKLHRQIYFQIVQDLSSKLIEDSFELNFIELYNSFFRLQELNKIDWSIIHRKFCEFSNQEIPLEIVEKFKMTGLAKEDFLTSDFLNRYNFKNLLQFMSLENQIVFLPSV